MTGVEPVVAPQNKVTHIVVTGTMLTNAQQVYIGPRSCHNTVVTNDTTINTDTDGSTSAGIYPLTVRMKDTTTLTGPNFTFTSS